MTTIYVLLCIVIAAISIHIKHVLMSRVIRHVYDDIGRTVNFVHKDKKMTILRQVNNGTWTRQIASLGSQSHEVYPESKLQYYSAPFGPGDYFLPIPLSHRHAQLYFRAITTYVAKNGITISEGCLVSLRR